MFGRAARGRLSPIHVGAVGTVGRVRGWVVAGRWLRKTKVEYSGVRYDEKLQKKEGRKKEKRKKKMSPLKGADTFCNSRAAPMKI